MMVLVYTFVILFAFACIFPFLYVISYSVMPYSEYLENPVKMIPSKLDFGAYKEILKFPLLYSGYRNTLFITIVGTLLNLTLLIISAYPLSKADLKGRKIILWMILFTMLFSGGMIPRYYLVRELGLINSLGSLILPGAISAYNLILMKNFVGNIPDSLEEAALIDGANELQILWRIIVPLSKAAIASFAIMCAVNHWNSFFDAVIFLTQRDQWPLMLVLREMVFEGGAGAIQNVVAEEDMAQTFTIQMAMIVVIIVPIICVYPFLQKYFVTGLTIGGVKE
ncbi:carbohydrate ABC transporter permease [Oscillospiraceae bacterium DSM 107454]|uniref:Carbohydrate ABC transporter permease n=2 Tax=Ructibacterium gallinarum TaxID=2779355 RepID=A0A9D5M5M2_9FIRM|nr:carbohydrate ABC transporter permease [Ructibacterium gallinarum]